MRKLFASLAIGIFVILFTAATTQAATRRDITYDFTCPAFRAHVAYHYSNDPEGRIFCEDVADSLMHLVVGYDITNLGGIHHFTSLNTLHVRDTSITTLDVSGMHTLRILYIIDSPLVSVDVSDNPALVDVSIFGTYLTEIDVSNLPALEELWVFDNQLTTLDVSNNPNLELLFAGGNQLTSLDVSNNPWLETLSAWGNNLNELDVTNNLELMSLNIWGNRLTELDISNNPWLEYLDVSRNRLTALDLSNSPWLQFLDASGNSLTTLDVYNNQWLDFLDVSNNNMQSPDDVTGWEEIGLVMIEPFVFEWQATTFWPQPTPAPAQAFDRQPITLSDDDIERLGYAGLTGYGIKESGSICRVALGNNFRADRSHSIFLYETDITLGPMATRHLYQVTHGKYIYVEFLELARIGDDAHPAFKLIFIDDYGNTIYDFGGLVEIFIPMTMPQHWRFTGVHAKVLNNASETGYATWEPLALSFYWEGDFSVNIKESQLFTPAYNLVTFPDMPEGEYGYFIEMAASRGLVRGFPDGYFRPDGYISRAEFVYMIYTVLNLPASENLRGLLDVRYGRWYYNAVTNMHHAGVLDGVSFLRVFRPSQPITNYYAWMIMDNLGIDPDVLFGFFLEPNSYVTRAEAVFYQMSALLNMYW